MFLVYWLLVLIVVYIILDLLQEEVDNGTFTVINIGSLAPNETRSIEVEVPPTSSRRYRPKAPQCGPNVSVPLREALPAPQTGPASSGIRGYTGYNPGLDLSSLVFRGIRGYTGYSGYVQSCSTAPKKNEFWKKYLKNDKESNN